MKTKYLRLLYKLKIELLVEKSGKRVQGTGISSSLHLI